MELENSSQVWTFQYLDFVGMQKIQEKRKIKEFIWVWQHLIHQDLGEYNED